MESPEEAHPGVRRLYDYWLSISPPGALPGRQHLDPVDIPDVLPGVWLLDVHRDPLRFWLRLTGTAIDEFAGRSMTGGWFTDNIDAERKQQAFEYLREVVETREPSWRRGRSLIVWQKEFAELERIYLPLAADGRTVDMILCFTVFHI